MSIPNREAEIGDAVESGKVWDGVEWMQDNYKKGVENLAKKLGIADLMDEVKEVREPLSNCCGAVESSQYPGLCSDCKEHADFSNEL